MTISKKQISLLGLLPMLLLSACHDDDAPKKHDNEKNAISFSSLRTEQESITRAEETTGLEEISKTFNVFGYKHRLNQAGTDDNQLVFPGYTVDWKNGTAGTTESNALDWEYVGINNASEPDGKQTIKYWDFESAGYDFFAYVPQPLYFDETTSQWKTTTLGGFNADTTNVSKNLTIVYTGLKAGKLTRLDNGKYTTEQTPINVLFSNLVDTLITDKGSVILPFQYGLSKVRIAFFMAMETGNDVPLTNIKFFPVSVALDGDPSKTSPLVEFATEGKLQLDYKLSTLSASNVLTKGRLNVSLTTSATTSDPMSFADVVLAGGNQENEKVLNVTEYHVLPMGVAPGGNSNYKMSLNCGDDNAERTAIVPKQYMQWEPNKQYTYIFKVTYDAKKEITLSAIEVEEWEAPSEIKITKNEIFVEGDIVSGTGPGTGTW